MSNHALPSVDILVAIYRPNPAYLKTQLHSLNAQDYPNLRILLLDDSGDEAQHARIASIAKESLKAHPYKLLRNAENQGVTKTFARLTEESEADLLAYCDQDDEWLPEKISRTISLLCDANAQYNEEKSPNHRKTTSDMGAGTARLGYVNQSIMDGQGRETYPTLQAMNRRFTHKHGAGLFPYFLQDNCIPGCTLVMYADVARAALPFPEAYVHDQWLALCAASQGPIAYDPAPLIRYRLHGGNVIGMASLAGVSDAASYVSERLRPQMAMLNTAADRFPDPAHQREISRQKKALGKRISYISRRKLYHLPALIADLWRDPLRLGLETLLGIAPQKMGERLIAFAKNR